MASNRKILWLCGVPYELERNALNGKKVGASASWSWVMAHLPPPENVELHIACPAKNIKEDLSVEYNGATFHLFPCRRGAVYSLYRVWMPGFRRVFKRVSPDWVHGWGVEAGFGAAASALSPKKSSIEVQGLLASCFPYIKKTIPFWFALLGERLSLKRGRRYIAESNYSAESARKHTSGVIRVVNQPLRDEFLSTPLGSADAKQMVFLGTLNEAKGIKDTICAFAETGLSDWRLCCIGQGDGGYMQEVRTLINELGLVDRVELCGTLTASEIIEQFQKSPIFLLPTYMDTGPNALKEALAMGLWPVCYDNSGPGEFIRKYEFGSLAETGNICELADVLKKTIAEKPWQGEERRSRCVSRIRHDLSRETVWAQLLECYSDEFWKDAAMTAR